VGATPGFYLLPKRRCHASGMIEAARERIGHPARPRSVTRGRPFRADNPGSDQGVVLKGERIAEKTGKFFLESRGWVAQHTAPPSARSGGELQRGARSHGEPTKSARQPTGLVVTVAILLLRSIVWAPRLLTVNNRLGSGAGRCGAPFEGHGRARRFCLEVPGQHTTQGEQIRAEIDHPGPGYGQPRLIIKRVGGLGVKKPFPPRFTPARRLQAFWLFLFLGKKKTAPGPAATGEQRRGTTSYTPTALSPKALETIGWRCYHNSQKKKKKKNPRAGDWAGLGPMALSF